MDGCAIIDTSRAMSRADIGRHAGIPHGFPFLVGLTALTIAAYLSGQVQLVATGNVVAASINGQKPSKLLEVKFLIKNSPCYIGLNKNQPELQAAVNEIIAQAKKDGQLEAIAQNWLHTSLPQDF